MIRSFISIVLIVIFITPIKGQIDSNYWYHGLTVESLDSPSIHIDTFNFLSSLSKSGAEMKDTIPILMLVCDTSRLFSTSIHLEYDSVKTAKMDNKFAACCFVSDTTFYPASHLITWEKGYAERTLIYGSIPCPTANETYALSINCMGWSPISETYLDADKKSLSKNIIVWMSKYIINQ